MGNSSPTIDHLNREIAEGERLHVSERIVVAPKHGRFALVNPDLVGDMVEEGEVIGMIQQRGESHCVVSQFCGRVIDILVYPGQLLREGEPIAWLRIAQGESGT